MKTTEMATANMVLTGSQKREYRYLSDATGDYRVSPELRIQETEDKVPTIFGYAAVFNSWSESIGGLFREVIRPGTFTKTLKEKKSIKALWDHNTGLVLGSQEANTLELNEDKRGLFATIRPPRTADREIESIQRRDVTQMSFGFRVIKDQWTQKKNGGEEREILEVELFEVSPVAFPAYQATSVDARSIMAERGVIIGRPDAENQNTNEPKPHSLAAIRRSHQIRRWRLDVSTLT